ncbi:calmodulin-binding protein [Neorhodopirellula lusitana]|uniref:calmodulin-binding protein n=1 Tax=Neorhodopirellula lusitana TaxID=445327 RepID=UPI00384D2993
MPDTSAIHANVNDEYNVYRESSLAASDPSGTVDNAYDNHMASLVGESTKNHKRQIWEKYHQDLMRKVALQRTGDGSLRDMALDSYMLEKLDPKHRMGNLLLQCLNRYKELRPTEPFFEWLDGLGEFGVVAELRSCFLLEGNYMRSCDGSRIKHNDGRDNMRSGFRSNADSNISLTEVKNMIRGVAYLDQQARNSYRVDHQSGLLCQGGKPIGTDKMRTAASGIGWGIFVLSPSDVFYTGSHSVGQFHHSSFLQGHAVKGAGEWMIDNGILKIITAKSGHYRPQKQHFVNCLMVLRPLLSQHKTDVKVFPQKGESDAPNAKRKSILVNAEEFLRDPGKYEVWS